MRPPSHRMIVGDCREVLRSLAAGCVQTVVTSPPYFGLRAYLPEDHPDKASELGTEKTPDEYVGSLIDILRSVRGPLRDEGTLWLVIGDCFVDKQLLGIP